jgi:hypothetical protein
MKNLHFTTTEIKTFFNRNPTATFLISRTRIPNLSRAQYRKRMSKKGTHENNSSRTAKLIVVGTAKFKLFIQRIPMYGKDNNFTHYKRITQMLPA